MQSLDYLAEHLNKLRPFMHRFKSTRKLFSQIQEQATAHTPDLLAVKSLGALAQHGQAMSAADISVMIRTAAAYVLGQPVTDDEPLTGAGLDSLGECPPPMSFLMTGPNAGTHGMQGTMPSEQHP